MRWGGGGGGFSIRQSSSCKEFIRDFNHFQTLSLVLMVKVSQDNYQIIFLSMKIINISHVSVVDSKQYFPIVTI